MALGADENGKNATSVTLDGELTVAKFRKDYRDATTWGKANPDAAMSRDARVDAFNAKNPVGPASQQGADSTTGTAPDATASVRPEIQSTDEQTGNAPGAAAFAGPVGLLLAREDGRAPDARAVKLLQTTINEANRPDAFDWNWSKTGRIDVDGDLGPQTLDGLARANERLGGEDAFAHRFAAASFQDFARRLDRGREQYENLPGALDATFGRLDPDAALALQDTLNVTRAELPAHVRYPELLRDGEIGPVTTDAFRTALYGLGPDHLAENLSAAFGSGFRRPGAGAL